MQSEFIIAIMSGLGGMLGWGGADFFAKKTIDRIGAISSLVWAHFFGTALFIVIAALQFIFLGKFITIPNTLPEWGGLIFFGTLQMVVYWLVYEGFGKGKLAVLNPIFASYSGLVALFSVLIFKEVIGGNLFLALVVIFVGILLLNVDIAGLKVRRLNIAPGLKEIATATLLAAFWTLGWDRPVTGRDSLSYALFMYAFMTLAALIVSKILRVNLLGVKRDLWKFLVLIGLGETIAYFAISVGYSATSFTSVVALLSGAFSLPTIILARLFLKEKLTTVQTIGSVVIIAGIVGATFSFTVPELNKIKQDS